MESTISLTEQGILLHRDEQLIPLEDSALSGMGWDGTLLRLYAAAGKTIELRDGGPRLAQLAATVSSRICVLREVTRPLRALGARRGRPGEEHDRFFEPFLTARSRAESRQDNADRLAEFDAEKIALGMEAAIDAMATVRYPKALPEQRALRETLLDVWQPGSRALVTLGKATKAAQHADDRERFDRWREWLDAIEAAFSAADRAWLEMLTVVDQARGRGAGRRGR